MINSSKRSDPTLLTSASESGTSSSEEPAVAMFALMESMVASVVTAYRIDLG